MKIAVCLSGQLRTWRQCYESWDLLFKGLEKSKHLENEVIEIDYFVHTWDFNSKPYSQWTLERQGINGFQAPPAELHDQKELEDFLSLVKPKKYLIENEEKSDSRKIKLDERSRFRLDDTKWPPLSWSGSQLYGLMMAGWLKKEYELENGFKYDMVVRLRPDLHFNELNRRILANDFTLLKPKTVYSCHSFATHVFPHDAAGDIFFYSDSETYDVMSSLYNWLPQMDPHIFRVDFRIEEMLVYFMRMFNFKNMRLKLDPKVQR